MVRNAIWVRLGDLQVATEMRLLAHLGGFWIEVKRVEGRDSIHFHPGVLVPVTCCTLWAVTVNTPTVTLQ